MVARMLGVRLRKLLWSRCATARAVAWYEVLRATGYELHHGVGLELGLWNQ